MADQPVVTPAWSLRLGVDRVVFLLFTIGFAVFLWRWLDRNVGWTGFLQQLSIIPSWAIAGSIAINVAALILYGKRMALLLKEDLWRGFAVVNVGYALNTVMPLRLGDALKVFLAATLYRVPVARILAATFVEKVIDLFALFALGVVVVAAGTERYVRLDSLIFPALVGAAAVLAIVVFRRVVPQISRRLPRGGRLERAVLDLHEQGRDYPWAAILLTTLAIWLLNVLLFYFVFNTYIADAGFGIMDAVALLIIVALATSIPSMPAGIGMFEAGIVAYLTGVSGVGDEAALAGAVAFHLAVCAPQLLFLLGALILSGRWKPASAG